MIRAAESAGPRGLPVDDGLSPSAQADALSARGWSHDAHEMCGHLSTHAMLHALGGAHVDPAEMDAMARPDELRRY